MILEAVVILVVCMVLIAGFTLAGMSLMKRGIDSKGATGTLGSVLGMLDPAGAPTKQEAAAAREELKQQRHESAESGKDFDRDGPYGGKITIRGTAPGETAPAADPKAK